MAYMIRQKEKEKNTKKAMIKKSVKGSMGNNLEVYI
jgi:hypothetical protein